jgi:parallel beta-helix repeat protein
VNKTASGIMLILFLVGSLSLVVGTHLVKAEPGTIYIHADGSIDPTTANIETSDKVTYTFIGDINDEIVVERDNIVVDGAGYTIQGSGSGDGFYWFYIDNVTIKNTNIRSFRCGIRLPGSSNCTITGNSITNNSEGVELYYSSNCTITGNSITNNGLGIVLYYSSNDSIRQNNIENNYNGIVVGSFSNCNTVSGNLITNTKNQGYGILLDSSSVNAVSGNNIANSWCGVGLSSSSDFNTISANMFVENGLMVYDSYGNVVVDNTVNSKPLVYLESASNQDVADAGQVILINCKRIRVQNLNLSHTTVGLQLWNTNNTLISANSISANNQYGIYLYFSSNNTAFGNNITNNWYGIYLEDSSSNNRLYHNNVISNTIQVHTINSYPNVWDDGYLSGGNYWSDYGGTDADGDGIGDSPYVIDAFNRDNYPLTHPFIPGDINHDGIVNIEDATLIGWYWQQTVPPAPANVDINGDGIINVLDATIVGWNWQRHA